MLTDEDKLELFDDLLRDALVLAKALQEQVATGGFGDLRTAWKNVHAARSLRDSPPPIEAQLAEAQREVAALMFLIILPQGMMWRPPRLEGRLWVTHVFVGDKTATATGDLPKAAAIALAEKLGCFATTAEEANRKYAAAFDEPAPPSSSAQAP